MNHPQVTNPYTPVQVRLEDGSMVTLTPETVAQITNGEVVKAVTTEKARTYDQIQHLKSENARLTGANGTPIQQAPQTQTEQPQTQTPQAIPHMASPVQTGLPNPADQVSMADQPNLHAPYTVPAHAQQQLVEARKQLANEAKTITREDITAVVSEQFQNLVAPVMANQVVIQQSLIEDYKTKRIVELGDTIIPELVTGDTKVEIEASLARSAEARARYAPATPQPTPQVPQTYPPTTQHITPAPELVQPTHTQAVPQTVHLDNPQPQDFQQPQVVNPPMTQVTQAPTGPVNRGVDVKAMDMDTFGANREALKQNMAATYGRDNQGNYNQ